MNIKLSLVLSFIVVSPLVLHAATSPIRFGGTDSEQVEKAIAEACRTGERGVCIGKKPDGVPWLIECAILLPSDFVRELNDCLVQLKPGTRDNLIRNAGVVGREKAWFVSCPFANHTSFLMNKKGEKGI